MLERNFVQDLFRAAIEDSRANAATWKGGPIQEQAARLGALADEGKRTAGVLALGATSGFFAAMICDRVAWAAWTAATALAPAMVGVESPTVQTRNNEAGTTLGLYDAIDLVCEALSPYLKTLAGMQLAALEAERQRSASSGVRSLVSQRLGATGSGGYQSRLSAWVDERDLADSLRQHAADLARETLAAQDMAGGVWAPSVY